MTKESAGQALFEPLPLPHPVAPVLPALPLNVQASASGAAHDNLVSLAEEVLAAAKKQAADDAANTACRQAAAQSDAAGMTRDLPPPSVPVTGDGPKPEAAQPLRDASVVGGSRRWRPSR